MREIQVPYGCAAANPPQAVDRWPNNAIVRDNFKEQIGDLARWRPHRGFFVVG